LIEGLRAETAAAGKDLDKTIKQVDAWPSWAGGNNPRRFKLAPTTGGLSETRGSFRFDADGLPPAP
jgi:hypothetical protein